MPTTFILLECTGAGAGARATQDHCLATDLDDLRHGAPPPLSCQGLCCRQVRPHVANRLLSSFQEHKLKLSTCFRSNLEDIRASHACVPNPCFASQPNPFLVSKHVPSCLRAKLFARCPILFFFFFFTSQQQLIAGKVDKYHL